MLLEAFWSVRVASQREIQGHRGSIQGHPGASTWHPGASRRHPGVASRAVLESIRGGRKWHPGRGLIVGGVPRRLSICQNEGFFKWHFEELQSFTVSYIPPWIYSRSPETLLSIDARLGSRHNRGHTGSSGMRRRICTRLMVRLQSLRVFIYTTYSRNTYQLAHATQYIDLRTLPDTGSSAHKTKKLRKMYHDA